MPAQMPCPISEVDRALSSYINSREDTLRIRRALSKYLTSSLRPVNAATQLQHLNHECPQNLSATNTNPPGLKDTRLVYLQALRARAQTQAKHRELQASLEQLRIRHVDDNPTQPESEYDADITRSYVSLLRQRRRHAELQVIQESFDKLLSAKTPTTSDPRELVKRAIGEQPDLPAERLEHFSQTSTTGDDNQAHLFKLKKQVLEARASMERAQAARKAAQDEIKSTPSAATSTVIATLQSQVHALEQARNEIVDWIQGELAKLEEEEEESLFLEDASPVKRPLGTSPTTTPLDMTSATAKIQTAYQSYTSARATLLDAHTRLQHVPPPSSEDAHAHAHVTTNANTTTTTTTTTNPLKHTNPFSTLVPHLHPLLDTAHAARALTQQSMYLCASLSAADADAQETLLRLAGESHLLPAGTKEVAVWGDMAREADEALEKGVADKMGQCRSEVKGVEGVVELCSLQARVLEDM